MPQTSGQTEQETANRTDVSLIAHRGFAGVYPENTVAAVEQAVTSPAANDPPSMVEIDVMPTADGEIVTFHDWNLGRLTDAPDELADRNVWEVSYDTLAEFEVLGTGERVPTLTDVLDALPEEVGVNVEFKNPGSDEVRPRENLPPGDRDDQRALWQAFADEVLDTLSTYDHDVLISSFCEGALAAVRESDSSVPIAAVFAESIADGMEIARRYDCEAVHPPWNMIADTALFNADYGTLGPYENIDLVTAAHEEGRAVNVWTVESWYQANQLRQAGVDGLITDYPGVLRFGDQ
ncbi:glycerophosphodiester phosphodiesterase [Halorussus ruber]|uniref:glycerophosphodiester phosphodiesterase n=1 Tax=Halorussus ruber TaxID=1126238 RepID=UPI001091A419|nr:glycerophosphodiester phosphodiesterase [Halorussus ruber]